MTKTIFFDLDGTLTDSGEGIINCAIYALEKLQLPIPSRQELRIFVGPPLTDTFPKFGVRQEDVLEAVRLFRERYMPIGIHENKLYPGITEMLTALRENGHILCIATSKLESLATEVLENFGIDRYFHHICGATPDHRRDTKEQVLEHLLRQCDLTHPPVMVGDTVFDVLGAKAHQIPTIGVAWGYGSVEEMKAAGAAAIVYDTMELLKELNS